MVSVVEVVKADDKKLVVENHNLRFYGGLFHDVGGVNDLGTLLE